MSYTPYSTGTRHMFAASDCVKVDRLDLDENEFLKVVKWPLNKFKEELRKCSIRGVDCAYASLDFLDLL